MSRLRRDLHGLKKEVQAQRLEIERLGGRVTLLSVGAEPPRAKPTEPVTTAQAEPKVRPQAGPGRVLPVVRLRSKADPSAVQPVESWENPGAQDDGSPPIVIKLGPKKAPKLKVDHDVLKRPDPVLSKKKPKVAAAPVPAPKPAAKPAVAPAPKKLAAAVTPKKKRRVKKRKASRAEIRNAYDAALAKLRDDKNPRAALEAFDEFVEGFKKNRLTDNAVYWSGECHRALNEWDGAADAFADLLRSYPHSAKVPYAKVGLGQSRIELGDHAAGKKLLRQVIDEHPTSEAAREAKTILAAAEEME